MLKKKKIKKPKNAQYIHDGMFYKKGVHDKVFIWVVDQWILSTKRWSDIVRGEWVLSRDEI